MANVLIILILVVLVCVGLRRIYRTVRFGDSCCSSGEAPEKKIRVKDRNKANYPYTYGLYSYDGLGCSGQMKK